MNPLRLLQLILLHTWTGTELTQWSSVGYSIHWAKQLMIMCSSYLPFLKFGMSFIDDLNNPMVLFFTTLSNNCFLSHKVPMIFLPISPNKQKIRMNYALFNPFLFALVLLLLHRFRNFFEDQRIIQMLMGLNDSYKIVRGQILMMRLLPSLSGAYSLIIQEERQRAISIPSTIKYWCNCNACQFKIIYFKLQEITSLYSLQEDRSYKNQLLSSSWFPFII